MDLEPTKAFERPATRDLSEHARYFARDSRAYGRVHGFVRPSVEVLALHRWGSSLLSPETGRLLVACCDTEPSFKRPELLRPCFLRHGLILSLWSASVYVDERYQESSSGSPPMTTLSVSALLQPGSARSKLGPGFVESHSKGPRERIQPTEYCGCYVSYDDPSRVQSCAEHFLVHAVSLRRKAVGASGVIGSSGRWGTILQCPSAC